MKKIPLLFFMILLTVPLLAQSKLDCKTCHSAIVSLWQSGKHGTTQADVASELAAERAGQTPNDVINGSDAENCIACHGALAVTANGGMSETDALAYFFSTDTNGAFSANTQALNTDEWPNVACVTCHNVPSDHPVTMPTFAIYDSRSASYTEVSSISKLCGQCHGSLRFPGTDHLREDAWASSKHGHGGQADVGQELTENAGLTPAQVINNEDCIACHAPTSVLMNGGMTEAEALSYFFTTTDSLITSSTAPQNTDKWPEVSCIACHDPHQAGGVSYFNSSTAKYEAMSTPDQLCGQCHGNLRFPDTDHLSYNIAQGTGGVGVSDTKTMPGVTCIDCHMVEGPENSRSSMYAGHSWKVFVTEEDGSITTSCNKEGCHPSMDAGTAMAKVESFQKEYAYLDSVANDKIAKAEAYMTTHNDPTKKQKLKDAQFNLAFAEGDESGGVHNHNYTKALLNKAIENADYILTGVENTPAIVKNFALYQNYPNPFGDAPNGINPVTNIKYEIPKSTKVTIEVFDILGNKIATLFNGYLSAGVYHTHFNASNIPAGVYFYRMKAGNFEMAKKLVLLK